MAVYDDYPISATARKALEARDELFPNRSDIKTPPPPPPEGVASDIPAGGCLVYANEADAYYASAAGAYLDGDVASGDSYLTSARDKMAQFNACVSKEIHMDPFWPRCSRRRVPPTGNFHSRPPSLPPTRVELNIY